MPEKAIPIGKAIPIIVVTWILSLVTTLAIVYVAPTPVPIQVTAEKIADGAIITAKLADGSVTSAKILDGTITAVDLATGSVTTIKIADGAVTTAKIADDAVTSAKILDGTITAVDLADNAIVAAKIADGVITADKIADGAVVTIKLDDGSVTSAKILDGTITAVDLATGSVTTIKIADGAVTTNKIADYAVTSLKLAANAIPFNYTSRNGTVGKSTTTWETIPGMLVKITLERKSTLLIMFSVQSTITAADQSIGWQALVDTDLALPGVVWLQPNVNYLSSVSYTFYKPDVDAGQYTIYIQWAVGGMGVVGSGTLFVIALPA